MLMQRQRTPARKPSRAVLLGNSGFLKPSDLIRFLYEEDTHQNDIKEQIRKINVEILRPTADEPIPQNEASLLIIATHAICSTNGDPEALEILIQKLREAGRLDWEQETNDEKKVGGKETNDEKKDGEQETNDEKKVGGQETKHESDFKPVRNTALMVASEFGNLEVVKTLHNGGANLRSKNEYECTALFLAIESDQLDVAKYLVEKDEALLKEKKYNINKYGKTLMIVAAESASIRCIEWLVKKLNNSNANTDDENCVNEQDKFNRTPLLYACLSNQKDIIDILMDNGADPELGGEDKEFYTRPLHWAAIHGSSHGTKRILTKLRDKYLEEDDPIGSVNYAKYMEIINRQDGVNNNTPLMYACKNGHYDIVKQLIDGLASRWIRKKEKISKLHAYYDDEGEVWTNAFYMALINGHIRIATDFFMVYEVDDLVDDVPKTYQMYNKMPHDILTEEQLGTLALVYADIENLKVLLEYAVKYDFHFNLFIELFGRFTYLNSVLNIGLRKYFELLRDERIKDKTRSDIDLTLKFTQILSVLKQVQVSHPLERLEAIQFYDIVNKMVDNLFECPTMSKVKAVEDSLCYLADIDNFMRDENLNLMQIKDKHVRKSYAFREGPINISLDTSTTALFSSGQISIFIDHLFYNYLRKKSRRIEHCVPLEEYLTKFLKISGTEEMLEYCENIRKLKSVWINARYNPCIMFYLEGASKLLVFIIAASICLGGTNWGYRAENGLILLTVMQLAYEYGELVSGGTTENHRGWPEMKQFVYYFDDKWNFIDLTGYILLLVWSFGNLHIRYGPDVKNENLVHATQPAISLSTIFLTTGILRYFTVNESMGKLTIMLFAMIKDLLAFTIVFTVCLCGFVVTLYGLLHQQDFGVCDDSGDPECEKDPYFTNLVKSFITMFSATLGNFDLDIFYSDTPYRIEAQLVLITFMVVFAITLLSLLVARMSATHDNIDNNSTEVWQFQKARFTQSFLLIDEKNPLNMLPPPLNLLIVLFVPFHLIELWKIENYIDEEEIIWGSFLWGPFKIVAFIPLLYKKFKEYIGRYCISCCCSSPSDISCWKNAGVDYASKYKASEKLTIWQDKVDFEKGQVLSICGTIADVTLGITFSFLAPLLELASVTLKLAQSGLLLVNIFSFTLLCLGYVFIYPIYVMALVYQSCHLRTLLVVHDRKRNSIIKAQAGNAQRNYLIHFDKERCLRDVSMDERFDDKAYLHIYLIKGLELRKMMPLKSSYTVRFILNGIVGCTDKCPVQQDAVQQDAVQQDASDKKNEDTPILWNNNHVYLPLDNLIDSGEKTFYVSLVNGEDDEIAKSDDLPVMKWIQDSRYEGMINLIESQIGNDTDEKNRLKGKIQVAIKVTNPKSIPKHKRAKIWNNNQKNKISSNASVKSEVHSNNGVGNQLSRNVKISPDYESVAHEETVVEGEGVECTKLEDVDDDDDDDDKILQPIKEDEQAATRFFMEECSDLKGAPAIQFADDELHDIFEPMVPYKQEKMTKKLMTKMINDEGVVME